MSKLAELIKEVEESLLDLIKDEIQDNKDSDDLEDALQYDGRIFELVDGCVPIWTNALIDLAAENNYLLTEIPELAGGESLDALKMIQLNIFEVLESAAYEYLRSDEIERLIADRPIEVEIRRNFNDLMTGVYWETLSEGDEDTSESFWDAFNAACMIAQDNDKTSLIIE